MQETEAQQGSRNLDLQGLLFTILRKYRLILFCALVGAFAMGYYSLYVVTPMYSATCKLYALNAQEISLNSSILSLGSQLKYDYEEILTTWVVQEKVLQNLQLKDSYEDLSSAVTVKAATNSRIITITATYSDPQKAKDVADVYARVSQKYIAKIMGTDEPSIVSLSLLPTTADNAFSRMDVMKGFLAGMLLPILILAFLYPFNDRVRKQEDIRACVDVPVFAVLPSENGRKRGSKK